MIAIAIVATLILAFGNGANDNSKGVATLAGAKTITLDRALVYAAVATLLGSLTAVVLATGLIARFSGKGLVDAELVGAPTFLACVGVAAACTVLLATRLAMPISTTHSLVGAITGVGLSAHALHVSKIISAFFVPLLVAPLAALVLAAGAYVVFRWGRARMGVTSRTCVCVEREYHPINISADGTAIVAATGLKLGHDDVAACVQRYEGRVAGVNAQAVLDRAHMFTAGAISFARGLNDTPKMAALMVAAGALATGWADVAVGVAIAAGGLLAVRRVARTMSYRITGMNDGQAFSANLVSALLIIVASRFGMPVSTTHVSCGSLFGIGLVNRQARMQVIRQVVLAWVTTLPAAAAIGWLCWRIMSSG
ncbi:MAG: anion permease [Phycisphaerae bacterium]